MSLVKTNSVQLGQSITPTNNFVIYQPDTPDGTVRIGTGNAGSVQDVFILNNDGTVSLPGSSTSAASVRFFEDTDNGTNYVSLKAPASVAANVTWILPNADGSSGQVMATDASGNLSWISPVSLTGIQTITNKTLTTVASFETKVALANGTIDLATGNYFSKTISGATTFSVTNVPASGIVGGFNLELTNGGSATVTWWSNVKWAAGTAPTLTSAGRDILGFYTHDNGTTWNGLVLAKDIK